MSPKRFLAATLIFGIVFTIDASAQRTAGRPPAIKHQPVTAAALGQSITIRAVVTDPAGPVKTVTLFYATSRDAAPFKVPMQASGAGSYFGTIPGNVLGQISQVSYYIEAVGASDLASETPWYTVQLRVTSAAGQPGTAESKPSWKKPALIAGVGAAVVGGAILAASLSKGGGGSSGGGTTTTNVGTFAGSVTRGFQLDGGSPTYTTRPMTITIVSSGIVTSDTLQEGQHLEGPLSGDNFTLIAPVNETNLTGQVRYLGTVADGRITGAIDGNATTSTGTNGTYSGTFYAAKQ